MGHHASRRGRQDGTFRMAIALMLTLSLRSTRFLRTRPLQLSPLPEPAPLLPHGVLWRTRSSLAPSAREISNSQSLPRVTCLMMRKGPSCDFCKPPCGLTFLSTQFGRGSCESPQVRPFDLPPSLAFVTTPQTPGWDDSPRRHAFVGPAEAMRKFASSGVRAASPWLWHLDH